MEKFVKEYINQFIRPNCEYYQSVNHEPASVNDAKLRTIASNEIVIEFDTDDKKRVDLLVHRTTRALERDGYSFFIFNHNGRSPHIHIPSIATLDKLDSELRRYYKRAFVHKYCNLMEVTYPEVDMSLTTSNSLIAVEFQPHFKHNNVKRLEYAHFISPYNKLDIDLLHRARDKMKFYMQMNMQRTQDDSQYSWVLNWFLNTPLTQGNRDVWVYKNIAILLVNNNIAPEPYIDYAGSYDFSAPGELRGWMKWATSMKRFFNIREIEFYMDTHDIDISEEKAKWQGKN